MCPKARWEAFALADIDNSEWDGDRALGACETAADFRSICAGEHAAGEPDQRQHWALPHHYLGEGPNADGVRNALSRLPQTEDLTNRSAAESHLQSHLDDIQAAGLSTEAGEELTLGEHVTLNVPETELATLSLSQRRLGLRLLEYNKVVTHPRYGALMFEPGAFFTDERTGVVDPSAVRLRMDHEDPPTGLGRAFTDTPIAPLMEFQLSKTQRADEQLTLAKDGVSRGASVGFDDVPARIQSRQIGGMTVRVYPPRSARLAEVSTTWQPTFEGDAVTYMLHRQQEGNAAPMAENEAPVTGAPVTTQVIDYDKITAAILAAQDSGARDAKMDKLLEKFEEMTELQRAQFTVPQGEQPKAKLEDWVNVTLRRLAGAQISPSELKNLALDDVVTTEQPGLVPDVFTADYDDLISQDRPFLNSTREVRPPATGNSLTLPIITTRAAAGTQAGNAEKGALTTVAPKIGTGTFAYKSVFGGADISVQMILRADAAFTDLLTSEFAEAYALDCEAKAIAALLAGYTDSASGSHQVVDGGDMDPEDPHFGEAFLNSVMASKRRPDHIWMNAVAIAAFIDAKSPLTNAPLYSNLAAAFTAGGGPGGVVSGLIPVYVPALDDADVDIIIGPSRGFVWAEDPAIRLQADNPAQAGRDIVLAGGIFPAPRYADAFTTYTLGS